MAEGDILEDQVNPDHYQRFDKFEVIEITEQFSFNRGNVIKYVMRAGHKEGSDELVDLMKALWYLNREIDRINQDRVNEVVREQVEDIKGHNQHAFLREKMPIDTSEYKIP